MKAAAMKRDSTSKRKKAAGKRSGGSKRATLTQEEVLERIRAVVLENAVAMAAAVCEAGKRGSYLHAKFMYETAALYPPSAAPEKVKPSETEEAESLAELVLKRLELDEVEKQEREAAAAGELDEIAGVIT
jgi:hypothetical protein